MEVLRFGTSGRPLVAFPTSQGRFYQWEDFGLIDSLAGKIDAGEVNVCASTASTRSLGTPLTGRQPSASPDIWIGSATWLTSCSLRSAGRRS